MARRRVKPVGALLGPGARELVTQMMHVLYGDAIATDVNAVLKGELRETNVFFPMHLPDIGLQSIKGCVAIISVGRGIGKSLYMIVLAVLTVDIGKSLLRWARASPPKLLAPGLLGDTTLTLSVQQLRHFLRSNGSSGTPSRMQNWMAGFGGPHLASRHGEGCSILDL